MSSLTGTKIKDTYDGLLKTTDNGALGASAKQLTDGLGTGSPLYVSTSKLGVGVSPSVKLHIRETGAACGLFLDSDETTDQQNRIASLRSSGGAYSSLLIDANTHIFRTGTTERMRIDSSGDATFYGNVLLSKSAPFISLSNTSEDECGIVMKDSGDVSQSAKITYDAGASNALKFYNNAASERMRITSGGYLKASNNGSYYLSSTSLHELNSNNSGEWVSAIVNTSVSPYGQLIKFSAAAPNNTTAKFLTCSDNSANRLHIYSNGNVVNTNNSYGAISDAKLKENITDASPKLDDLMQVQVRNFNYIGDDKKQLGVVAQELETIFPAMIDESADFEEREVELRDENGDIVYETEQVLVSEAVAEELDEEGNVITPAQEAVYETVTTDVPVMTTEKFDLGTVTKSVKYSVFVPMLIKAVQEQQAIIDALEARVAALEV